MNVVVNGQRRDLPDGCSVTGLLAEAGFAERGVAVAVNGAVCPRAEWTNALTDGAQVEILTAVQGG